MSAFLSTRPAATGSILTGLYAGASSRDAEVQPHDRFTALHACASDRGAEVRPRESDRRADLDLGRDLDHDLQIS